jgi:hypothetical protein
MAWQDAEEIAAIADNLLIPAEIEEHLKRLRGRNSLEALAQPLSNEKDGC